MNEFIESTQSITLWIETKTNYSLLGSLPGYQSLTCQLFYSHHLYDKQPTVGRRRYLEAWGLETKSVRFAFDMFMTISIENDGQIYQSILNQFRNEFFGYWRDI